MTERPTQAMEKESMKNDHHRIPRFPQDRRLGLDIPRLTKTELYARLVTEATIDDILAEHVAGHRPTDRQQSDKDTERSKSDDHCRIT